MALLGTKGTAQDRWWACRLQAAAGQPTAPVDPPGLRDQVLQLFGEWCMLVEDQPAERAHRDFVARLQQAGFLKVASQSHGPAGFFQLI